MRIPSPVSMSTTPSSGRIAPFRVDGISAAAFGAGIGEGLMSLGAGLKAREETQKQHNRFTAMEQFSDAELALNEELVNARRDSPLNDANYYDRANSIIENNMTSFVNKLPADQQEEFKMRANELANTKKLGELGFDFTKKDAYYKEGITKTIEQSKDQVYKDPATLEKRRKLAAETIMSSGLSEAEKMAEIDRMNNELEAAGYKAEYKQLKTMPVAANNAGAYSHYIRSGVNPIIAAAIVGNLAVESGDFSPDVIGGHRRGDDGTAVGAAQWRNERLVNLRRFAAERGTSSADLKTQLDFVLHEMQTGSDEGAAKAYRLMQGAKTVDEATEIFMKFYERPNNDPNINHIAKRQAKARSVMGMDAGVALDDDPRYSNVHYEDRITMQNQVDSEITQEQAAYNKQKKAEHDSFLNDMYTGLLDGNYNRKTIDDARKTGALTDYDEIAKAISILDKKDADAKYVNRAAAKLEDQTAIWDPQNEDDKKGLNAIFGEDGAQALSNKDKEIAAQLVSMMSRQAMIAPDAMDHLKAQTVANNWDQARYAYDVLSQLRAANPAAFNVQVDEETAKRLSIFENYAGNNDEELQKMLRGPGTQEEIAIKKYNEEAAADYLKENFKTTEAITGKFDGWFTSISNRENAGTALAAEWRKQFTYFFSLSGNADKAEKSATEQINRNWGASDVGGQNIFMKYPPNKVGYQPVEGSYDWIREDLVSRKAIQPDDVFELVSDRTTESEVSQKKLPSYQISVKRDGYYQGLPGRYSFEMTEEMKTRQLQHVIDNGTKEAAKQALMDYEEAEAYSLKSGVPVPEEVKQRFEEAQRQYQAVIEKQNPPEPYKDYILKMGPKGEYKVPKRVPGKKKELQ